MECVKWGDWQQTKVPGTRGCPARVRLFLRAEKGYLPSSWGALVLDGCCPGEMSNYRLQQDCSILFGFDLHLIISCTCYSTSTDVELNTIQEPILTFALHKIKPSLGFRWNKSKNKTELSVFSLILWIGDVIGSTIERLAHSWTIPTTELLFKSQNENLYNENIFGLQVRH